MVFIRGRREMRGVLLNVYIVLVSQVKKSSEMNGDNGCIAM